MSDIVRTQGQIEATKAANERMQSVTPEQLKSAEAEWRKTNPGKEPTADDISGQVYQNFYNQAFNASGYGTGGKYQQVIQAATAAVQGLAGGDLAKALAGGSAPYLATIIAQTTEEGTSRLMAHAVVNAVLAAAQGNNALAGAAGAVSGEVMAQLVMEALYPGKNVSELSESEKQTISMLGTLAAGLAGGLIGDSNADTLTAAQAGKTTVENNALSDIVENKVSGVSQEEKYQNAQKQLIAAVEEFRAKNCAGMSAEACSAKISEHRDELLKGAAGFGLDFVPVVGDIKGFAEAQSALDYLVAAVGLIPGAGDAAGKAIKAAETALKKGDVAEASKLINKASGEISGYLPSPGHTSLPNSGVGSNSAFSVTNAQLGKKLGKHVEDFGGNASNAADRQRVLDIINDIGSNPDKVVAGKFAGQGVGNGASRGDVFFRIKGNDVVVTKPDGSFVTILKDGVNNTSVKNALKGDPK